MERLFRQNYSHTGRKSPKFKQREKSAIEIESPAIESESLVIAGQKSAIQGEKLAIEILKSAIHEKKYKEPTSKNLITIYEGIDANQIFGTREVVEILKCAPSTAREIMQKFKELNVVTEVKGKGKGKYRFRNKK